MSVPESLYLDPKGIFSRFGSVAHNYYLLKAAESGLPVLVLFLFLLLVIIYRSIYRYRLHKSPNEVGLLAVIAASLCIGFFQPIFNETYILILSAIIL